MKGKKLWDVKRVGGIGHLTEKMIDKMQHYGKAIRNNLE